MFKKYHFGIFLVILVIGLSVALFPSSPYGAFIPSIDGTDVSAVHGGTLTLGKNFLGNLPSEIESGQTYTITVSHALDPTVPPCCIRGIQLIAIDPTAGTNLPYGTITALSPNTTTSGILQGQGRLGHTAATNKTEIQFQWTAPDPATGPVEFHYVTVRNTTNAYAGFSAPIPVAGALPVNLVDFTGRLVAGDVVLDWSTSTEVANDYFSVERSTDGTSFVELDKVPGSGTTNSDQSYRYVDTDLPGGKHLYYRLRQVDLDGTSDLSPIVTIWTPTDGQQPSVFPNPAQQGNPIYLSNYGSGTIELVTATGATRNLTVENGWISGVQSLERGVYFLRIDGRVIQFMVF